MNSVSQSVLQLREEFVSVYVSLEKLKLSHYAALAEVKKWSQRAELAKQNRRTDLLLEASKRQDEYVRKANHLKE